MIEKTQHMAIIIILYLNNFKCEVSVRSLWTEKYQFNILNKCPTCYIII